MHPCLRWEKGAEWRQQNREEAWGPEDMCSGGPARGRGQTKTGRENWSGGLAVQGGGRNRGPSFCFCLDLSLPRQGPSFHWGAACRRPGAPRGKAPLCFVGTGFRTRLAGPPAHGSSPHLGPAPWSGCCVQSLPWASGTLHSVG